MDSYLASEEALASFLCSWETGALPKAEFTHAAHVAVCACVAFGRGPAETLDRMREGIRNYNVAAGGANTETSGYHETLTRFWVSTIAGFLAWNAFPARLDAVRAAVAAYGGQRDLYRARWSYDVAKDPAARREWRPPDQ